MSILSPLDRDLVLAYSPLMSVAFRQMLLVSGIRIIDVPEEEYPLMGCNVLTYTPRQCLMLDGLPNLQDLGKLLIGENAVETMECDLKIEKAGQAHLKDAIAHCESVRDYVSREIFVDILDDTEEHIDHLETQLALVKTVGEQNYLQSQMGEAS